MSKQGRVVRRIDCDHKGRYLCMIVFGKTKNEISSFDSVEGEKMDRDEKEEC